MKVNDAYRNFLLKVNQNFKSSNVAASKDRFVAIYNEEQIRRIEGVLQGKNNDSVREIQMFLVDSNIVPSSTLDNKVITPLPVNYLELSSAYCWVKNKDCKNIRLSLFEIKDFNTELILSDTSNSPSLPYREAPYYIGNEAINIFTDNFTIDKVVLSYYKYPRAIDISGYIKDDSSASTDIDPEGDDAYVNKVISMCAESFFRNYGDPQQFQLNKDRVINNN